MENIQNNQNSQQGPDGPIIIGVGTSTNKKTAKEDAAEFFNGIESRPRPQLSIWQRMAARRMARQLRKIYKETGGKQGISEEVYQEILKMLKNMR